MNRRGLFRGVFSAAVAAACQRAGVRADDAPARERLAGIFAFENAAEQPRSRLVVIDPDDGNVRSLSASDMFNPYMGVSPDGTRVACVSAAGIPGGGRISGVWVFELDGEGKSRQVLDDGLHFGEVRWSADGKKLLVSGQALPKDPPRVQHWLIDLEDGESTRLDWPQDEMVSDWSDDGRWVLTVTRVEFQRGLPPKPHFVKLRRLVDPGGEAITLTDRRGRGPAAARFLPGSDRVLYAIGTDQNPDVQSLWSIRQDGGDPRLMIEGRPAASVSPRVVCSPDGRRVAVRLQSQQLLAGDPAPGFWMGPLILIDPDGTERRDLDLEGSRYTLIDWR